MSTNRLPRLTRLPAFALLTLALVGCPPPEAPEAPTMDTAAEEERIRTILEETRAGVTAQDWAAVEPHITADWEIFSDGERMSWAEQRAFFEEHIADHRSEFRNVQVRVSRDGTLASVRFEEETEFLFEGEPTRQEALFTAIFERRNGEWQMVHLHRSTPPVPPQD